MGPFVKLTLDFSVFVSLACARGAPSTCIAVPPRKIWREQEIGDIRSAISLPQMKGVKDAGEGFLINEDSDRRSVGGIFFH